MTSPFYTPEHEAFRETVRRFVAKEIEPFAAEWDEAEEFPRELYERIYREVRVNAIGGGAEEIMRDLAARQMGW